jgi:hypothetical protein
LFWDFETTVEFDRILGEREKHRKENGRNACHIHMLCFQFSMDNFYPAMILILCSFILKKKLYEEWFMSWIFFLNECLGFIWSLTLLIKDPKSLFIVLFQSMICSLGFSVIWRFLSLFILRLVFILNFPLSAIQLRFL